MKPLNPIMAALVAAASATFASPGLALAKTAPAKKAATPTAKAVAPAADCLKALDDAGTDAVNALTCLVSKKPEARRDIGERLAGLVQGKDSGRQYLTDALLKDDKVLPAVLAVAKAWPEKNAKTPAKVAALYFVIGPDGDQLPAWAQVAALKTKFKPKMAWADRFAEAMTSQHWSDSKQVSQQDAANGIIAFLNDAAVQAKKVLDETRNKKEIGDSIATHDTTGPLIPTVPGGAGRKNPLDNSGAGFGFDDLYRTGAVTAKVYGPKDDGYRELSVKIYTVRNDDGSLQNMIGVVDITNPNAPYLPKFFPVTTSGEQKFALRDGGRPYVLNVDGDSIAIRREGTKQGDGSSALTDSVSHLFNARAEQARSGAIVRIPDPAGPEYYVMGQGGESGSALFFPREGLDNPSANPRTLRPAGIADVSMVDKDGVTVPVTWKPGIGKLPDGVNEDGSARMKSFMLVFDAKTKMWKPVEGEGEPDPRKKPKDPPAKPAGAAGSGTPAGPSAPATGGDTAGTVPTGDAKTLDEVVALAKKADWTDHTEGNKGFDAESAALVHIMTKVKDNKRYFSVFFDPSLGVAGNQAALSTVIGTQPLKDVRGVGRYGVIVFPKMEQYFAVPNFASYLGGGKEGHPDLQWTDVSGFTDFDSVEAVIDTVSRKYTKVDPKFAETVRARVKKYAPNGGYHISGHPAHLVLNPGDDKTREIWPNDNPSSPGTGDNSGMTTQKGPGTVYQLAGGPEEADAKFPAAVTVGDGEWKQVGADEATGIAMYSGTERTGVNGSVARQRFAIMVRYKKASGPARSKLITIFGASKDDPDYFGKPSGLKMKGVKDQELGDTGILRMYQNSESGRGGVAAYRTPSAPGNTRDTEAACAGPVLWWGMTPAEADKACRTDGNAQ